MSQRGPKHVYPSQLRTTIRPNVGALRALGPSWGSAAAHAFMPDNVLIFDSRNEQVAPASNSPLHALQQNIGELISKGGAYYELQILIILWGLWAWRCLLKFAHMH